MLNIQNYTCPVSLEEAFRLVQENRRNIVLGGCGWMSLGNRRVLTAIDLRRLSLDSIDYCEGTVHLGAYVTLRQIETNPYLKRIWGGVLTSAVKRIVGVQFRNIATIGGSVFSRFGFSDVNCALLAMDAYVDTYRFGCNNMEKYLALPRVKDIVCGVRIQDRTTLGNYQSIRRNATDLPILTVAVCKGTTGWRIAVGARPSGPALAYKAMDAANKGANFEEVARVAATELTFGSNVRAQAGYRKAMCEVLVQRAMKNSGGEKEDED